MVRGDVAAIDLLEVDRTDWLDTDIARDVEVAFRSRSAGMEGGAYRVRNRLTLADG